MNDLNWVLSDFPVAYQNMSRQVKYSMLTTKIFHRGRHARVTKTLTVFSIPSIFLSDRCVLWKKKLKQAKVKNEHLTGLFGWCSKPSIIDHCVSIHHLKYSHKYIMYFSGRPERKVLTYSLETLSLCMENCELINCPVK